MAVNRFVANDFDGTVGYKAIQDELGDYFGERLGRPTPVREESMVGGRVERLDQGQQAEDGRDGTITGDDDGGSKEENESPRGLWSAEGG